MNNFFPHAIASWNIYHHVGLPYRFQLRVSLSALKGQNAVITSVVPLLVSAIVNMTFKISVILCHSEQH